MSGFTIVGDKLNFLRYMAHFRSVHRGRFFGEIRTTAVRKLLPESWGMCCFSLLFPSPPLVCFRLC
jgi:DNA-directed RNA polymerase I subunit RPA2